MYFFQVGKKGHLKILSQTIFSWSRNYPYFDRSCEILWSKKKTFGKTGCFRNRNFDLYFENNFVAICLCQLKKLVFHSKGDFDRILQEIPVAIKQMAMEFFNSSGRNSGQKSSRLHLSLRLQNMKNTSQLWYWLTFGIGFSIKNYHLE